MKTFYQSILKPFGLSLFVSVLLASSTVLIAVQPAPANANPASQLPGPIPLGPPALSLIRSRPLMRVPIPSRTGRLPAGPERPSEDPAGFSQDPQICPSPTIDLKVLVIVADPTDTQTVLPAIRQVLEFQGTPYTVFTASPRPADPAANRLASLLASGCHGFYQGIILGNGEAAYSDPAAGWQSALTPAEWQALWNYEFTFSARQVSWYTFPTAEYGFNPPTAGFDTTTNPINAQYTGAGQSTFSYANTANPLTIQFVWAYKATPLDSSTLPLLQDSDGSALGAIRTYPDGTQNLALTFDSNAQVTHNLVLAYGVVNWLTRGLFLGERHIFLGAQVDDVFIDAHVWPETTPCGTDPEQTNEVYRMTGDDLQAVINWQSARQAQSSTQSFKFDLAFNGEGTTGIYNPDTLTPLAVNNQALFKWINHTYTHLFLDSANYNQAFSEISMNNQRAQSLGLATYNNVNLVTPEISGLNNPNVMQAAFDLGVRYMVGDTSRAGLTNPSPNAGVYSQHQPAILIIPRHPNNLFYNVTTPAQWTAEYNCLYRSFWGRDLTYQEIVASESSVLLRYLLLGDMDPWMFHQTNFRAYDGTRTLLGDLLDQVLARYDSLFTLPVLSPIMDDLGRQMAGRMAYNAAGVTASIIPGQSITISSQGQAVVPVTGLDTAGAETYGGQKISHIALNAGQTVTLPLTGSPTPTPTNPPASPTPTRTPLPPTPTPTRTSLPPTSTPTSTPLPPTPTPTRTSLPPTSTPTSTPLPPTPTPTRTPLPPTSTPTSTPLPPTPTPTPTRTSLPPTSTPTSTPLPPTPTRTPTPANVAPIANNDAYTMRLLNVLLIVPAPGVLANDSDANGNPMIAVLVSPPTRGVLIFNSDGSFTYTPVTSLLTFNDSFTYRASDGTASSNLATVTIRVNVP